MRGVMRTIGGAQRVAEECVQHVGEQQLLMLFLVVGAELDAAQRFRIWIALKQLLDRGIDVLAVTENLGERRTRKRGAQLLVGDRFFWERRKTFVIAIEEPGKIGVEDLVSGKKLAQDKGLEEPSGVGEVPFGWGSLGAGLYHHVFGRERLAQAHGLAARIAKPCGERGLQNRGSGRAQRFTLRIWMSVVDLG